MQDLTVNEKMVLALALTRFACECDPAFVMGLGFVWSGLVDKLGVRQMITDMDKALGSHIK
jgi:hypothetical protein